MATQRKINKTIVLPISEENYPLYIQEPKEAHRIIGNCLRQYPELFPTGTGKLGYTLKGKDRASKKLNIQLRRIKVGQSIYRIRPSFILPYMRGHTKDAAKALLLIRHGVPFWVITIVFGRNPMFWYRLFICLSVYNLVGTTVYNLEKMPKDILADEFHIRIRGVKAYVATVIGGFCFLGATACAKANELSLRKAYGVFKTEVQQFIADYQPVTINTDGWFATQNALQFLFNDTQIIECFLHAVIKIRDRATKKLSDVYQLAADKVWNIYNAVSKRQMSQQIRRYREWATQHLKDSAMKNNILKLCNKKAKWLAHFDAPSAYRTSAHLDRIMKTMERHAINSQMFHADVSGTSKNFRAFAMLYNFSPSCPAVTKEYPTLISPAARLNKFVYSENWLQNLLIASSLK